MKFCPVQAWVSTLRYTRLGRGGPRVSVVGLGFWQAGGRLWRGDGGDWVVKVVRVALEEGINFFDTAEIYGWGRSERLLGRALKLAGVGDEVIVASKVAGFRVAGKTILSGVDAINRRLGRTVDLIQAHWPPPAWIPLCRVIRALEEAVVKGKAHYYGLSNYPAPLVEKSLQCTRRIEPVSDQVQYSLAYRTAEKRLMPLLDEKGMKLIAWSPLAKGALAGATRPSDPAQRGDPVFTAASKDTMLQDALDQVARQQNLPRATVALAWIIAKGAIPIPGTRKPGRVREISQAGRVNLPDTAIRLLDEASQKYLNKWGKCYRALQHLRLIPCWLQYLAIRLAGGV